MYRCVLGNAEALSVSYASPPPVPQSRACHEGADLMANPSCYEERAQIFMGRSASPIWFSFPGWQANVYLLTTYR